MIYDVQSWQYNRFVQLQLVYQRMNKVLEKAFPVRKISINPATKKDGNNFEDLSRNFRNVINFIAPRLGYNQSELIEIGECICGMLFDEQRLPSFRPDENEFSEEVDVSRKTLAFLLEKSARKKGLIVVRRHSMRFHLLMEYADLIGDIQSHNRKFVTQTLLAGMDLSLRKKKEFRQKFLNMISIQSKWIQKMLRKEKDNTEMLFRVDKAVMNKQKARKLLSAEARSMNIQYFRYCDFCGEYMESWKGCPCKSVWYCDALCQAKHWKCHRKVCSFTE